MKLGGLFLLGSAVAVLGCVESRIQPGETGQEPGQRQGGSRDTGITISTVLQSNVETDVQFMQIKIDRIACAGAEKGEELEPLTRDVRVEMQRDLQLPGGIVPFANNPLDEKSQHRFTDHFEVVPPGCYDISGIPMSAEANASADCAPAKARNIQVIDGDTTEIIMVSQCKGPEIGAVDAVVALNQPPQLQTLTFNPSKFVAAGSTTTACATALDPNGDPLEFEWQEVSNALTGEVASTEVGAEGTTQCAEISPEEAGGYMFEVRIYDLVRDANENLVRVERWLSDHGTPNQSHDSLLFPVYAGQAAGAPQEEQQQPQVEPEQPEEPQPSGG